MSTFPELKNDRFLKALRGESIDRLPVWMMRQAGRYLPEYRKLQAKYSFFERCQTPELVSEITIQPIDIVGTDAAILFSDILVIPQALGFEVTINKGEGPIIHNPITTEEQALALSVPDVADRLHYVFEGISLTRTNLNGRVPLIGFAGAPWTIFCYLVQGRGSKDFGKAKAFAYQFPKAAQHVLSVISETTISYLNQQIDAGAQAWQLFDSWAGLLSPQDFSLFSAPYLKQITDAVTRVPSIVFAKGAWYALTELSKLSINGISLDWTISPEFARGQTGERVTLQGNLDPSHLLAPIPEITTDVHSMIRAFGTKRYIVNLGHGMTPEIPVDHAKAFVDAVHSYSIDV